ncbi:MAG: type VI secretion system ATPase TssH, partial [Desulfovibrio sp.]|nr:type VI secretion system ATPase TssH [Desulfovibrio sp.]
MDISRFTDKSREAVGEAQNIAAGMGHQETDAEHLALALIRQENGIVPRILEHMGVQTKAFAVALETALNRRPRVSGGGTDPTRITVTPRMGKVLAEAQNEARRMKDE